MPTLYRLLLDAAGLSQREAAKLHGVSRDTVKSWSAGRNRVPADKLRSVADLVCSQLNTGSAALRWHRCPPNNLIKMFVPLATDAEAVEQGFPCATAQHRAMALAAAELIQMGRDVELVPAKDDPSDPQAA